MTMNKVVILATADFDSAVMTNKQHLALGLSRSHDVVYLESMGLRRPTFAAADLRRIAHRLRPRPTAGGPPGGRPRPPRLSVVSPMVVPLHDLAAARAVNRWAVGRLADQLSIDENTVLWSFSPLTYGLEKRAGATVYHSVDLLHTEHRMPVRALLEAESALLGAADAVIASSRGVQRHLQDSGRDRVLLWENVADVELFSRGHEDRIDRVIFAGHLTPAKVDLRALGSVVDRGIELVLAGPMSLDGTGGFPGLDRLLAAPNVSYLGNLSPAELAVEVGRSKVGLIPYVCDQHSTGIFPMKVYEYLAAGLGVVSTPLASVVGRDIPGLVTTAADTFGGHVEAALGGFDDAGARMRTAAAQGHSWTSRIDQAETLLAQLTGPRVPVPELRVEPAC